MLKKTDNVFRISTRSLLAIGVSSFLWYLICSAYIDAPFYTLLYFAMGHLIFTLGSVSLYSEFVNLMRLSNDEIIHIFPVVISLAQVVSLLIVVLITEDFLHYYWFSGIIILIVFAIISRRTASFGKDRINISLDSVKYTFMNLYVFFLTPFSFHLIFDDLGILVRNQFYLSERVYMSGSSFLIAPILAVILRGKVVIKQNPRLQLILLIFIVSSFLLLRFFTNETYVMWLLWIPLVFVHLYNAILSRALIVKNVYNKKTLKFEITLIVVFALMSQMLNINYHIWFYGLTGIHLIQILGKHQLLGESRY